MHSISHSICEEIFMQASVLKWSSLKAVRGNLYFAWELNVEQILMQVHSLQNYRSDDEASMA